LNPDHPTAAAAASDLPVDRGERVLVFSFFSHITIWKRFHEWGCDYFFPGGMAGFGGGLAGV
jgi:hypothetical protein